jgi:hypothetical protein
LTYNGLETLLLGLPQLRVLRLLAVKDFKLSDLAINGSQDGCGSSSTAAAAAGVVMSLVQQVKGAVHRHGAQQQQQQQQQQYFVRLAQRQQAHKQQQQRGSDSDGHPCSSAAAAAAHLAVAGDGTAPALIETPPAAAADDDSELALQLQYLEVCDDQSPGDCVPQSALLAARQQSSSSRSGQGLPALADLLGAWHGVPGPARCRTIVFVNSGGSMVPLMR